jgi:hypothetical protein
MKLLQRLQAQGNCFEGGRASKIPEDRHSEILIKFLRCCVHYEFHFASHLLKKEANVQNDVFYFQKVFKP